MPLPAPLTLKQIHEASGLRTPNGTPYTHITATMVVWNDAKRLERLLRRLRRYFNHIVVGVQESPDHTLEVARTLADYVVEDTHSGFGDSTYGPKVLPRVKTPWVLKVDVDEMPNAALLNDLSSLTWLLEHYPDISDGAWIPFRSSVEGQEYTEQHSHLRLFRSGLQWPAALHSRPMTERTVLWHTGHIRHDRSLDEMMRDYLAYWKVGQGNPGWENHNREMMFHACSGVAQAKGWDFVRSFSWWPEVEAIAFKEVY